MTTPAALPKLLIVDDDAAQMTALCRTLESEGYIIAGFTSPHQALAALREQPFDVVLSDLMMPEMDGISLIRAALETDPNLVGIVMTGHGAIDTAVEAMKEGAVDYVLKPFKLSAVLPVLARALSIRQFRLENIELQQAIGLYEASMAIALATGFKIILEGVADFALRLTRADSVSILLRSENRRELCVAAARGQSPLNSERVPLTEDLKRWAREDWRLPSSPGAATGFPPAISAPIAGLSEGAAVPMLSGGALVGVLHAGWHHGRAVNIGQLRMLSILANNGAAALERASLLER